MVEGSACGAATDLLSLHNMIHADRRSIRWRADVFCIYGGGDAPHDETARHKRMDWGNLRCAGRKVAAMGFSALELSRYGTLCKKLWSNRVFAGSSKQRYFQIFGAGEYFYCSCGSPKRAVLRRVA